MARITKHTLIIDYRCRLLYIQNYDDKPACWNRKGVRHTRRKMRKSTSWLNVQIPHTEMEKPLIGSPVSVFGISYER